MDNDATDFIRGYDTAAGLLLRGEETPKSLTEWLWSENQYDNGMRKALNKLIALGAIADNRIKTD